MDNDKATGRELHAMWFLRLMVAYDQSDMVNVRVYSRYLYDAGINVEFTNEPREHTAKFLTVDDLAEILRISKASVRALAQKGELPARKIQQRWLFVHKEVEEHLLKTSNQTTK